MKVFEVMSEQVAAIEPDTPAATARQLMQSKGIHHLAVMRDGALEGVLSSRDIPDEAVRGRRGGTPVSELMHTSVITVGRNVAIAKAANLMAGHSVGALLVTERGRVIGIVTVSDLLTLVGQGLGRQPKRVARATLKNRVPHRKQHGAGGAW